MTEAAVICLCVLVGYYLWADATELYIAWYSGAEPPLTARTRVWIWVRIAGGLAAIAAALAGL